MSLPLALGWGVLGALLGLLAGFLSLRLERGIGELEPGERTGLSWIELGLMPAMGLVGFFTFAMRQGMGQGLLIHSLWLLVLVQITGFDVKHRLILDVVTLPALALALLLANASPQMGILSAVLGLLLGGVVLIPLAAISSLFHGGRGFGWGDVKLGLLIGAVTGINIGTYHLGALWALVAGSLFGGVVTLGLLLSRRVSLRDAIPYGPFLVAGCGLILYFM